MHAGDASKNVADLAEAAGDLTQRSQGISRGDRRGSRAQVAEDLAQKSQRISRRNLRDIAEEVLCDLSREIRDYVPRSARCIPIAINAPAITEME